jgi:gamma-glutamyltranspeptidase / glutathione hydrolase
MFVTQDGSPLLMTGQHGSDQQGMGNMQVLVNILDLGANLQAAGDMARFTHNQVSNTLQLESQLFNLVGQDLIKMGHKASSAGGEIAGGYQGIMVVPDPAGPNRTYRAGSNFREDGDSIGW